MQSFHVKLAFFNLILGALDDLFQPIKSGKMNRAQLAFHKKCVKSKDKKGMLASFCCRLNLKEEPQRKDKFI